MTKPVYLSTFAINYARKYATDEAEIDALLAKRWTPSTVDFQAAAVRHRPAFGVGDFASLIAAIRQHKLLTNVMWYGHGSTGGGFLFGEGQSFGKDALAELVKRKADIDVSAKFDKAGSITFFACNVAQNEGFIQDLANAMRIPVLAFQVKLEWSLKYDEKKRITHRGLKQPVPTPFRKDPQPR